MENKDLILNPRDFKFDDNSEVILSVRNINKYFSNRGSIVKVLDNVDFDIHKGDFFGVIGESGSGKSTTGKCIIRLISTSGGIITFLGNVINNNKISKNTKRWLSQNMQMIFQDPLSSLNPRKNVLSLVSEPIKINKNINKEARELLNICSVINPYFGNTFKWQDFKLNNIYLLPFYINIIKIFDEAFSQMHNIDIKEYKNLKELSNDISSILIFIESNYKKELKNIFDLLESTKNLIYENKYKLENRGIDLTEINVYDYQKQLFNAENILKESAPVIQLRKDIKILEEEIYELEIESKKKYVQQNQSLFRSLKADYKTQDSLYKQKKQISTDLSIYSLNKIKELISSETLKILKKVKDNFYLEFDQINEFIDFIDSEVKKKYDYIFSKIITLSNIEENSIDKIIKTVNKDKKTLSCSDEMKDIYKLNSEINSELNELIKKETLSSSSLISDKIKELTSLSNINKNNLLNTVQTKNSEIKEKIQQLNDILNSYKKSEEKKSNKESLKSSKKNLLISQNECKLFADLDNRYFLNNCMVKIEKQNNLIKNYFNKFSKLKNNFNKEIKKILHKINRSILPKNDADFKVEYKRLKEDIKNKVNSFISFQFEYDSLIEQITLYKNLRTKNKNSLRTNYLFLKKVMIMEKVFNALDQVGLKNEHAYRYPHEFSGGQRQRIVIARSLISNPKFIIADEPISALDVSIQAQVINIMKDLSKNKGITFMFIAHDLSMVNFLCNRMVILHKGRIVEKGNTNEIFNNPIHPYTVSLIKASPELSKIHVDLSSFEIDYDYDKDYSIKNVPSFKKITSDSDHEVFCTESQFKTWVK